MVAFHSIGVCSMGLFVVYSIQLACIGSRVVAHTKTLAWLEAADHTRATGLVVMASRPGFNLMNSTDSQTPPGSGISNRVPFMHMAHMGVCKIPTNRRGYPYMRDLKFGSILGAPDFRNSQHILNIYICIYMYKIHIHIHIEMCIC